MMGSKLAELSFTSDGIAIIRMRNGENRINPPFVKAMTEALDQVERNTTCKALITTGEGKFYSNGLDLAWQATQSEAVVYDFLTSLNDLTWRLIHFPLPTVAALNGHTYAGGGFLAMAHDYRVMNNTRGWICWNETKNKLRFRPQTLEVMSRKMPNTLAVREAVLFSKPTTAARAVEFGLVDIATHPDSVLSSAISLAQETLGKSGFDRNFLQTMKKDLYPRTVIGAVSSNL